MEKETQNPAAAAESANAFPAQPPPQKTDVPTSHSHESLHKETPETSAQPTPESRQKRSRNKFAKHFSVAF